jgi:hypothetical protein
MLRVGGQGYGTLDLPLAAHMLFCLVRGQVGQVETDDLASPQAGAEQE